MDLSGDYVFNVVRSGAGDEKAAMLHALKTHVKKDNVQLQWVGQYFEALSIASDSPDPGLQTLAFSLVCHLVKRVSIQDHKGSVLLEQSFLVLPLVIPRIADVKTLIKIAAKRALEAYWLRSPEAVEQALAELALCSRSALLVNESVVWLNYILTSVSPQFKLDQFLDPLARILRDHAADDKLTANIKVLLENYYELKHNRIRKFDLQKVLERNNVPAALRTSIMGTDVIMSRKANSPVSEKQAAEFHRPVAANASFGRLSRELSGASLHTQGKDGISGHVGHKQASKDSHVGHAGQGVPSAAKLEHNPKQNEAKHTDTKHTDTISDTQARPGVSPDPDLQAFLSKLPNYAYDESITPINVAGASEISLLVADMEGCFEGKETERNWSSREKSIVKLRSVIRGNGATELLTDLIAAIKEVHEGICKSLLSLRTTLSVNSCQLVKEMAFIFCSHFEPLFDLFVPTLIKLCSNTKHLTNINAHVAMCAILAQCPLTNKTTQKILNAASEKSVNTKAFASCWLQIYMIRSHDLWTHSGSDLADKMLVKLLPDPNVLVRLAAKDAYWKYFDYAEQAALELRTRLDSNVNRALERSRPKGASGPASSAAPPARTRPSLKDSILAKKKELQMKQADAKPASRSVSRSASRGEINKPSVPSNDHVALNASRKPSRTPSFADRSRAHLLAPPPTGHGSKSLVDGSFDEDMMKSESKSPNSSPESVPKKLVRPLAGPKSASEPHYAQSTFAHPSTGRNQSRSRATSIVEHQKAEHARTGSFNDHSFQKCYDSNRDSSHNGKPGMESVPKDVKRPEPKVSELFAASDESSLNEGIRLLRRAILNAEQIPSNTAAAVQKLLCSNPTVLRPLFEADGLILKHAFTWLPQEDFLRMACIFLPPVQETFEAMLPLFASDDVYVSVVAMLSCVLELNDIFEKLVITQYIKFKDRILTMLMRMLMYATGKIPITDVNMSKLLGVLFELFPVLYRSHMMVDFKALLCTLYAINSKLFVSQLSQATNSGKQEIELMVGIDHLLEFRNPEPTLFHMSELTRISPGKSFDHLSPLKYPSDFTMVVPPKKVKLEPGVPPGVSADDAVMNLKDSFMATRLASPPEELHIRLEEPPAMEIVQEEDVVMEEPLDSEDIGIGKNTLEDESMDQSKELDRDEGGIQEVQGDVEAPVIKLEVVDFNATQKPDFSNQYKPPPANGDGLHELVEDFASVRLTGHTNTIETFIEKVDPLQKMSSRNRPINIYDDSKAGSPQKVRDYDFTELNWFNFLMAKMTLHYGVDDVERYSKADFRSLCEELSAGTADETAIATTLKYLRVPEPKSLMTFLKTEGFLLAENAVIKFLTFDHSHLVGGLMIIKQLLVNRYRVEIYRLWELLVDLSGLQVAEPLHTLEIAIGETFDEVLCGMYPSQELTQIAIDTLCRADTLSLGSLKFTLGCLFKLVSVDTLVLSIDGTLVAKVDGGICRFISHEKSEIRKLVVEIYGRLYRAARTNSDEVSTSEGTSTGYEAMVEVMLLLTVPQQRIIEYFSQA